MKGHVIVKVIAVWNIDEQDYGWVFVHSARCPACQEALDALVG